MRETNVIPAQVLAQAGTQDPVELAKLGIAAAKDERWKTALVLLTEAYNIFGADQAYRDGTIRVETDVEEPAARKQARGRMFSYYGLALAMSNTASAADAARFCEIAIQKEPYQAEHYVLLARIWQVGRSRIKTVQAVDRGLKEIPNSRALLELRGEIGWREKNAVAFLPRSHPLNVTLGKMMRKKRDGPKNGVPTRPPAPAKPKG